MIAIEVRSTVEGYIADVMDGTIPTGKLVQAAIRRHLRDIERVEAGDKSFPFYFDWEAAEGAILFFQCLRHTIGDFSDQVFLPEPWQMFALAMIFGWKKSDGSRRFATVYFSMARKNGKSTIAAALALLLASSDINPNTGKIEEVAQVILAATKIDQVKKVIWAELSRMRDRSPAIRKRSEYLKGELVFSHNLGTVAPVGSDKPFSGLNPLAVLMDELHEWRDFHVPFYETITTGSGSRSQPITMSFTTAGTDASTLWLSQYEYFCKVVTGAVDDPEVFVLCYELDADDDVLEERNWIKANPNLGVSVKVESIRKLARQAAVSEKAKRTLTRYHCNRIVSAHSQAFQMDQFDACEGDLSDWRTSDAIGAGIDLGGRDDLGAAAFVARFPLTEKEKNQAVASRGDDAAKSDHDKVPLWRYEAKVFTYIAEDCRRNLEDEPFPDFIEGGFLQVVRFPIKKLLEDVIAFDVDHYLEAVAYDPHNAQAPAEDLEDAGVEAVSCSQNTAMFNEPIGELMQAIADGRFRHDGNPVLRWCCQNAILVTDRSNRSMFDKKASKEKIDGAVALVMALRIAMIAEGRPDGTLASFA